VGSGTEQVLGATYLALDTLADTAIAGFQRAEASIVNVVVVGDYTSGSCCMAARNTGPTRRPTAATRRR
jgi:hypothetical protein